MKKLYILFSFFIVLVLKTEAQTNQNFAVEVQAVVQKAPASIKLIWPLDTHATQYQIFRRTGFSASWGSSLATLSSSDTTWTDNNVTVGVPYEYRIFKQLDFANTATHGHGYIYAGIEVPAMEDMGGLILVVENSLKTPLATEIEQLQEDLTKEGWSVHTLYVDSTDAVTDVKNDIKLVYQQQTSSMKAIFLLGHVPVPYSGSSAPDAHPDHYGAWPADAFYAEMNGTWTDYVVNIPDTSVRPVNANIPNDGKYDQDFLPSDLEMQIGRADFKNLPDFSQNEIELTRRYLNKNHAWRTAQVQVQDRAVVENTFGVIKYDQGANVFYEAFSSAGYRSFAPMFGYKNVESADYRTSVNAGSYMWAYGAGAGSDANASGITKTSELATDSPLVVFTSLFGSYFGDWNTNNNLLRAALAAKGLTLASTWSGRPYWDFHTMALGYNIGFSQILTQNDYGNYFRSVIYNASNRLVSSALIGDPTIKMYYIAAPSGLAIDANRELTWTASTQSVEGYNVYRRSGPIGAFTKINSDIVTATSFTDTTTLGGGEYFYMVRAVSLQETASGSYYNLSPGSNLTSIIIVGIEPSELISIKAYPNPSSGIFTIDMPQELKRGRVVIKDAVGKEVMAIENLKGIKHVIDLRSQPAGIYFVNIYEADNAWQARLIKE